MPSERGLVPTRPFQDNGPAFSYQQVGESIVCRHRSLRLVGEGRPRGTEGRRLDERKRLVGIVENAGVEPGLAVTSPKDDLARDALVRRQRIDGPWAARRHGRRGPSTGLRIHCSIHAGRRSCLRKSELNKIVRTFRVASSPMHGSADCLRASARGMEPWPAGQLQSLLLVFHHFLRPHMSEPSPPSGLGVAARGRIEPQSAARRLTMTTERTHALVVTESPGLVAV